jgi:hypothetical protein
MRDEADLIDDLDDVESLAAIEGANVPERVEGTSTTGPRENIDVDERRKRRQSLANLLAAGRSEDEIIVAMRKIYGMSSQATLRLRDVVYEKWAQEDRSRSPHLKAAARRRIYDHLRKAARVNQFTAVANLERTLAGIEGTEEPRDGGNTGGSITIGNAVIAVLGDLPEDRLQELIDSGTKIFLDGNKAALPSGEQITVKPIDEKEHRQLQKK